MNIHSVRLHLKFKIAVGGCPNNCVKPDLNDLGIIGQKVHGLEKCRGCKICRVEKNCPINVAKVVEQELLSVKIHVITADAVSENVHLTL